MKAIELLHQKTTLNHVKGARSAILEIVVWQVARSGDYPEGVKFRAGFSESGRTIFGVDNHKPKGPHLHVGDAEVAYVFRGVELLIEDIVAMVRKEGFEI